MSFSGKLRTLPGRLATGGFILHTGLEKWEADETRAEMLHGMAAGAYPALKAIPPTKFVKLLAAAEVATGGLLLLPVVPEAVAGLALTAFSSGLVGMYLRTPALRKEASIWPSQMGLPVSKDVWMLAIGLGLLLEAATGGGKRKS